MKLQKAFLTDISELQKVCVNAYSNNFYDHWNDGGLEWYVEREFSVERLESDILDKDTEYYFIKQGLKNVGFIKTKNNTKKDIPIENALALEKIYVLPECKGMGMGKAALNVIIKQAEEGGKEHIYLCVLDTNIHAIAFYEKLGFLFHSTTILDVPYFKEGLKGMHIMVKTLAKPDDIKN